MQASLIFKAFLALALTGLPWGAAASGEELEATLEEDARILGEALRKLYPSYDRYDQGEAIDRALAKLEDLATTSPEPMAFYRAVTNVAAATRDEHVIPFPSDGYRQSRQQGRMMLPYTVRWIDETPYLAAIASAEHRQWIGSKVVRFDDQPAGTVLATLRATIPSDGYSETFAIRHLQDFTPTQNENYFDLNYPIWFGERDRYSVTIEDDAGIRQQITLDALDWESFLTFYRARLPRTNPVEFRWLDETTGYLAIRSFHDHYYKEHSVDPAARFEAIFGELSARQGAALILDLRQNEGGGDISSLLLDHLLSKPFIEYDSVITRFVGRPPVAQYCENEADVRFDPAWANPQDAAPESDRHYTLKPEFRSLIMGATQRAPRADAFGSRIIVLISGATGSAAAKVSAVLKREGRAQFVGEETGGAAAGATAFGYCTLRLPTSKIRVDLPIVRFEREVAVPYGRGVMPDIAVDAGKTAPLTNTDEALSAAMQSRHHTAQ